MIVAPAAGLSGVGLATLAYAGLIERNAFRLREMEHCGIHVALFVLGALVTWWLIVGGRARSTGQRERAVAGSSSDMLASRLESIERSVDVVAVEVERVGEAQRFMTRVFTEQGATPAGEVPTPVHVEAPAPKPAR